MVSHNLLLKIRNAVGRKTSEKLEAQKEADVCFLSSLVFLAGNIMK